MFFFVLVVILVGAVFGGDIFDLIFELRLISELRFEILDSLSFPF